VLIAPVKNMFCATLIVLYAVDFKFAHI
jgi:hypothetical protein